MLILPALDLRDGHVVRLHRGRFDRATVYSDDPLAVARGWAEGGARALHVVDLDGARGGRAANLDPIHRIRADLPDLFLQVGGGLRAFASSARMLDAGVNRVVFGTSAVEDPRLLARLLERYGADRVSAALDIRAGRLGIRGWEDASDRTPDEVFARLKELGIRWTVCTDILRDGTLDGPGLDLVGRLLSMGFQVVAAGGVTTVEDVVALREAGAAGCIIGRALYDGVLALEDALAAADAD